MVDLIENNHPSYSSEFRHSSMISHLWLCSFTHFHTKVLNRKVKKDFKPFDYLNVKKCSFQKFY